MTERPVYLPKLSRPFYTTRKYEFDWNAGQSAAQKQKNIQALHQQFHQQFPDQSILEVSTKSDSDTGKKLSPFNLTLRLPSLKKDFPVESVYHASKTFRNGGPYVDLLGSSPAAAKKDARLQDSGELVSFRLENSEYPASPSLLFFNWLYLKALLESPALARAVTSTDAFTDIESSPAAGSINQAMACAIFHSLSDLGLLEKAKTFEGFKEIMMAEDITSIKEQTGKKEGALLLEDLRKEVRRHSFRIGDWLVHPGIGTGEVIRKNKDSYYINFRVSGPRTLSKDFVELNCKPVSKK